MFRYQFPVVSNLERTKDPELIRNELNDTLIRTTSEIVISRNRTGSRFESSRVGNDRGYKGDIDWRPLLHTTRTLRAARQSQIGAQESVMHN